MPGNIYRHDTYSSFSQKVFREVCVCQITCSWHVPAEKQQGGINMTPVSLGGS